MKDKKSIYLFASSGSLDRDIQHSDLNNKYYIVGSGNNIEDFYNLMPSSIDYLIIFANRKKINNLDKHHINFLYHVFNHIVVVGKTQMYILNDYIYIPEELTQNKLQIILKMMENGINKPVIYSYKNFCKHANIVLEQLGFKSKHKGYEYILNCAYNIATINTKCNLKLLYNLTAQQYNTTVQAVERCIRSAIGCASNCSHTDNLDISKLSNKKFILQLNKQVVKFLM